MAEITNYEIIRTKRRSMAIYVRDGGKIEIRCGMRTSLSDIEKFISEKEDWIKKAVARTSAEKRKICDGAKVLFLGNEYVISKSNTGEHTFGSGIIYLPNDISEKEICGNLAEIYKTEAKEYIPRRVRYFESVMNLYSKGVKITSAETRWGSCSGKNVLCFPWRLMMADSEAIDYVIVHELAHIKEKNHGKYFWKLVELYIPDYRERRMSLRKIEKRLAEEKW